MSRADRGPLIDMVSAVAAQSATLPPGKLALFAARAGRSYANELMVVGRALNGGAVKFQQFRFGGIESGEFHEVTAA